MQGIVLSVASQSDQGLILGDDGVHYTYTTFGWRDSAVGAAPGMKVDFDVRGSHALGIYPLPAAAASPYANPSVAPGSFQPLPTRYPPESVQSPAVSSPPPEQSPHTPSATPTNAQWPSTAQPPLRNERGVKWWYWTLALGGVLVVLGVVSAVTFGFFSPAELPFWDEIVTQSRDDSISSPPTSAPAAAPAAPRKAPQVAASSQDERSTTSDSNDSQANGKSAAYQDAYQYAYAEKYSQLWDDQLARFGKNGQLTERQRRTTERNGTRIAKKYAAAYAEMYAGGESDSFAHKYAELIVSNESHEWALAYTEIYTSTGSKKDAYEFANSLGDGKLKDYAEQRDAGRSHEDALAYAHVQGFFREHGNSLPASDECYGQASEMATNLVEEGKSLHYASIYSWAKKCDSQSEEQAHGIALRYEQGRADGLSAEEAIGAAK